MFLNKEKIKDLMYSRANNNYHEFARQLGVDVAQIHRILNTDCQAGPKFLGRFKVYCNTMDINFDDYIFLDKALPANNRSCPVGRNH